MMLFSKNLARELVIVAEVGVNHEGDPQAAAKLIRLAADAGADAVKLQSYSADRLISHADPERLNRVRRFGLDVATHRSLAAKALERGVQLFSTAASEDVVPLLAELFPAIKIASGDLTFEFVIRAAARTGKPVILSTGCGTLDEVDTAVGWVRDEVGGALPQRLVLMHCVSAYPAPIEEANLSIIPMLANRHGVSVGYSNHVVGSDACLAAVALGASVIETHFTDRKSGRTFRDHALSLEPDEFAVLVQAARRVHASLGQPTKVPQPSEISSREAMRKGVVAARDLGAGMVLERDDLMWARPATEFAANDLPQLVGRKLLSPVARGATIRRADLEERLS
jgi:N-acetylneuraminate synthase/N,N'-diacetyllegionaminate synthase